MIGIDVVFDFINDYMPSPLDRGAWIAKDADGNDVEVAPDPDAEFTGFVFATIVDPLCGQAFAFPCHLRNAWQGRQYPQCDQGQQGAVLTAS